MDKAFFARVPKAEHHLHLEGAWPWETVRRLHPRGASLPDRQPWLEGTNPFRDFDAFVAPFREYVLPCFTSVQSLEVAGRDTVAWLARHGVRYAEFQASGDFLAASGIRFEDGMAAYRRGLSAEGRARGVAVRLFAGLKRNYSADQSVRWMEQWLGLGEGFCDGVDLMGYEAQGPAAPHRKAFEMARAAGLRLKAHAGEHGGPENVREAIEVLGVTHISHGVRAVEDPALVRELARRGTVLDVCPTSNVMLGVCRSIAEHPVRALFDAGVRVTVNTDDPLLFGNDLPGEYLLLHRSLGFTAGELRAVVRTGLEEALIGETDRARLLAEADAAFAG